MTVDRAAVVRRAADAAFGRPLVTNSLRGLLVEAMIAATLEPHWHWCGSDWRSWDFGRGDGLRLEVKQSSYRQTWDPPAHGRISPSFDIRERTGRYEGAVFIEEPGRAADVYVFAYHGVRDETAIIASRLSGHSMSSKPRLCPPRSESRWRRCRVFMSG